jgi:hypothetical protein
MLRELDGVVSRDERSLGSRILLWLYPNRGWIGGARVAGAGAYAEPATEIARPAVQSSSPLRKKAAHAV